MLCSESKTLLIDSQLEKAVYYVCEAVHYVCEAVYYVCVRARVWACGVIYAALTQAQSLDSKRQHFCNCSLP